MIWSRGPFWPLCRGTRLQRASVQLSSRLGDGGTGLPDPEPLFWACRGVWRPRRVEVIAAGTGLQALRKGAARRVRIGGREFRAFLSQGPGGRAGSVARPAALPGAVRGGRGSSQAVPCSLLLEADANLVFLNRTFRVTFYDVVSFAVLNFDLISHCLVGYAN